VTPPEAEGVPPLLLQMMAQGEDPAPGAGTLVSCQARADVIALSVLLGPGEKWNHLMAWCVHGRAGAHGSAGGYLRDTQISQIGPRPELNTWGILLEPRQ
jgi:hypothetical protein